MPVRLVSKAEMPFSPQDIAFSPDGRSIVALAPVFIGGVFAATEVAMFETATGIARWSVRTEFDLSDVVLSRDGNQLALSGFQTAMAIRPESGVIAWNHPSHSRLGIRPSFSPEGTAVLTGFTGAAFLFDAQTGAVRWQVNHSGAGGDQLRELALSPDGRLAAEGTGAPTDGAAPQSGSLRVLDGPTGRPIWAQDLDRPIRYIRFSPDGSTLVYAQNRFGNATLVDARTGAPRGTLVNPEPNSDIIAITVSPDGALVATLDGHFNVRLFDSGSRELKFTVDYEGEVTSPFHIEFTADSAFLLAPKDHLSVRMLSTTTGREAFVIDYGEPLPVGGGIFSTMSATAISADGRLVAIGGRNKLLKVFEPATDLFIGLQHGGPVRAVTFDSTGGLVATGSDDKTARVFDAATGDERAKLDHDGPVHAVSWLRSGEHLISGSADGRARVFDIASAAELTHLTHDGPVNAVAGSPDGNTVATGSDDGTARLLDVGTGASRRISHDGPVVCVVISTDGRLMGTASKDGSARVINTITGALRLRLTLKGPARAVAFSPNGRLFAAGGDDGTVMVSSLETGLDQWQHDGFGGIRSIVFTPDSGLLGIGGDDGIVRVFSAATGDPRGTVTHDGAVNAVAFGVDGGRIGSASDDETARISVPIGGAALGRFEHGQPVHSIAFSPDNQHFATACADGTARIYPA